MKTVPKPTKRSKKTPRKKKEELLDSMWSCLVKFLADGQCEYCGKTRYLNSHHIYSRTNKSTRWDIANGICLCSGHHLLNSSFSAHKTPSDFTDWVREKRGRSWYKALQERKNTYKKFPIPELDRMVEDLRKSIMEFEI